MTAVVEETKVSDSLLFWDVTLTVTDRPYCTPGGVHLVAMAMGVVTQTGAHYGFVINCGLF